MRKWKIVLAVVNHNQEDLVLNLLKSLNKFVQGVDLEVVLIDNLKPGINLDESEHNFPIYQNLNLKPLGFAKNVNRAFSLRGKDADFYCIINPDVELTSSIFPVLINKMAENSIDVISPIVIDRDGNIQDSFRPVPSPLVLLKRRIFPPPPNLDFNRLPEIIYPDWIAGIFMLIKPSAFHQTGGFTEIYNLYFEDVDFCLKAKIKGFRIGVVKEISILHDAQRKSRKSFRYLLYHMASAIRFFFSKTYWKYRQSLRSDPRDSYPQ
jgi:GT2 family glycosyltransferase